MEGLFWFWFCFCFFSIKTSCNSRLGPDHGGAANDCCWTWTALKVWGSTLLQILHICVYSHKCHLWCRQQRSRVLRLISGGRSKTRALERKAGNREQPSEVSPAVRLVAATQAPSSGSACSKISAHALDCDLFSSIILPDQDWKDWNGQGRNLIRTLRKITEEPRMIIMEPPSEERINFNGGGDYVIYDFLFRSDERIWINRARLWLMTVLK